MELLLNLCWLALLLPAYLLWRRRGLSGHSARSSSVVVGTLGCALVLLFPVVSVSDDLHAVSQAMEESERGFRYDGHRSCSAHSIAHVSPLIAPASASLKLAFEQLGTVLLFASHSPETFFASASAGRAPPQTPVSL